MEYIELLGIEPPLYKSKLLQFLLAVPSPYTLNEIKLLLDQLINGKKVRFEFELPIDKANGFASELIAHGFLIGDSSFHEEGNQYKDINL